MLKEAKRIEFPDNVISQLTDIDEADIEEDALRLNGIVAKRAARNWLITLLPQRL